MAQTKLQLPPPFAEIMRRYEREMMRYLLRVSCNREDALDLFQETWLRAYRAYPGLRPETNVRPWLYTIAVNLCRNHARDGNRRSRVVVAAESEKDHANRRLSDDQMGSENEGYAAIWLRELIRSLPVKQREAFRLRYFAGFNYREIAIVMNCSQESARANVSQATKKFRSMW